MKHSKHIARIVTFALLALTMIGSFIGCKNATGGDGSEDLTGFYVWKPYPNAEGEQVNYYAQFTKSTLQIYKVTEADGKVSFYEQRLGKRADSQDASSWNLQSIPYTAKGGVLTISATSTHRGHGDKPYTGSYDATGITIPGILIWPKREEPVTMTKTTDNFFNRIAKENFKEGWYINNIESEYGSFTQFIEFESGSFRSGRKTTKDGSVSLSDKKGTYIVSEGNKIIFSYDGIESEGMYSKETVKIPGDLLFTGDSFGTLFKTDTPPDLTVPAN